MKSQTLAAAFLERNGLHTMKLSSPSPKRPQKAPSSITLLPHITTAWNQRVAEAEAAAETAQKKQKSDQNQPHQAKKL